MTTAPLQSLRHLVWVPLALILLVTPVTSARESQDSQLDAETIKSITTRHFASYPDRDPCEIISQSEVTTLLDQFRRMGWQSTTLNALTRTVLRDNDFLVRQLRTPAGKKFSKKIARYPDGYERMYQIVRLNNGRQLAHDLIHDRGGNELVEYLTTTAGGKNLSQQLSKTPQGAKFGESTNLLFTQDALTKRLLTIHAAENKSADQ